MIEVVLFGIIFLALAYGSVLWFMGRREDVLHGEFVEGKLKPETAGPPTLTRPVFPKRPAPRAAVPSSFPPATKASAPEPAVVNRERLELLLNSIKQDLNQLVQK